MTEQFYSYVTSVMTVGICAFICESISGSFSTGKSSEKALGLICSLCMLCVILIPVSPLLNNSFDFDKMFTDSNTNEKAQTSMTFSLLIENETSNKISNLIFEKFGIQPVSTSIDLNITDKTADIKSVRIILNESDFQQSKQIKDYLVQAISQEAEIIIEK